MADIPTGDALRSMVDAGNQDAWVARTSESSCELTTSLTPMQVYIDGEFYGGCDIMIEKFQNGELVEDLERALNS